LDFPNDVLVLEEGAVVGEVDFLGSGGEERNSTTGIFVAFFK
jgi:hypothetical protein